MTLGKRQSCREGKHTGGCRGLRVEEMPPRDMGDERSRVTALSGVTALPGVTALCGVTALYGVTALSGVMDLHILTVVVVTQLSSFTGEHTKKNDIHHL